MSSIFKTIRSDTVLVRMLPTFYYETIKREVKKKFIYECRCDERLKVKDERSTRLVYTVWCGGLEHRKMKTRLIDEKFPSVMDDRVFVKL